VRSIPETPKTCLITPTDVAHTTCVSWLACESDGSGNDDAESADVFAGKPAPTTAAPDSTLYFTQKKRCI
jgi:hypothetical protein